MKKTIHIHLGGMPFTIDEDAFQHTLNKYLERLKIAIYQSDLSKKR
jgi:hypothetical protein